MELDSIFGIDYELRVWFKNFQRVIFEEMEIITLKLAISKKGQRFIQLFKKIRLRRP